jgi:hypothetical protein
MKHERVEPWFRAVTSHQRDQRHTGLRLHFDSDSFTPGCEGPKSAYVVHCGTCDASWSLLTSALYEPSETAQLFRKKFEGPSKGMDALRYLDHAAYSPQPPSVWDRISDDPDL